VNFATSVLLRERDTQFIRKCDGKILSKRDSHSNFVGYVPQDENFRTKGQNHMNYNWRRTFVLAMACLLCVAGYAGASARTTSGLPPDGGTARLVVHRIPTIGKFVIVQIYVDDVAIGSVAYGGTYEGFLKPGHHVLSVLATPRPKWGNRPPTIVDVRSGQTYRFTAMGNGQGNLILRPVD
jgi:hypothetical protein